METAGLRGAAEPAAAMRTDRQKLPGAGRQPAKLRWIQHGMAVVYRSDQAALPHCAPDQLRHWLRRVEFLGKHTDYAGGRSLLCAVERGISILVTGRADRRLRKLIGPA